jgi:hypothetical protein
MIWSKMSIQSLDLHLALDHVTLVWRAAHARQKRCEARPFFCRKPLSMQSSIISVGMIPGTSATYALCRCCAQWTVCSPCCCIGQRSLSRLDSLRMSCSGAAFLYWHARVLYRNVRVRVSEGKGWQKSEFIVLAHMHFK